MTTVLSLRKEDEFSRLLRSAGIEVICCPLIETVPVEDQGGLNGEISRLDGYDGIFLTSSVAAKIFVEAGSERLADYQGKIYSLGESSRRVIAEAGLNPANDATANTAEEMLEAIGYSELKGRSFLYLCGDRSMRSIHKRLDGIANVQECVIYRTLNLKAANELREDIERKMRSDSIQLACFFSPSAVDSFLEQFTSKDIETAAIGATTANALKSAGFNVEVVSPIASQEAFAEAVIDHFQKVLRRSA